MANISAEGEYSCLSDGAEARFVTLSPTPVQSYHAPSTAAGSSVSSQSHLYQTSISAEDSTVYPFAFAGSAASSSTSADLVYMCESPASRFLLDLHHQMQFLQQPSQQQQQQHYHQQQPYQTYHHYHQEPQPDFDLFSHFANSSSSSSGLLPFEPEQQLPDVGSSYSPFSMTTRVHDGFVNGGLPGGDRMYGPQAPSPTPSTDSSSPSTSSSSSSAISSPISADYDESMMMAALMPPVIACANCKRSHIKCDSGRPCTNCRKHPSKALTCRDAIPKPRGRPKGGSKAAAEAMLQARMQQQHQMEIHSLQAQGQVQFPRPRVMSLPQQARPHLPQLEMQYDQQYSRPYSRVMSRSSPTSPSAIEHRAIRFMRRPSLPAWHHHHPYAMGHTTFSTGSKIRSSSTPHPTSWNVVVTSPTSNSFTSSSSSAGVAQDLSRSSISSSMMPPPMQTLSRQHRDQSSIEALHMLQERLPMAGLIHASPTMLPSSICSGSEGLNIEPRAQDMQQELLQFQMMHQSLHASMVKSDLSEGGIPQTVMSAPVSTSSTPTIGKGDQDLGMDTLLQQQIETQAELQHVQKRQQQLQERFQKQQIMVSLRKQHQQQQRQQHYA